MMKADTKTILTVMTNLVARKLQAGIAKSADPVRYYGFSAADVVGLHFWKRNASESVWFRLADGRVIDADGNATDTDPTLYERDAGGCYFADAIGA